MKKEELHNLERLLECEIIRFEKKENDLLLLVVGDNEEEEDHHHEDEEEEEDECCSGLNGHLFLLHFYSISSFSTSGEECDNYKTKKVESTQNSLFLELEGSNFTSEDNDVTLSFSFDSFTVIDKGEIKGPDA